MLGITGSLTRFLERRFGLRLSLCLHEQFVDRCQPEEARLLDCDAGSPCLRRQVSLLHRGKVMFDAESVLPLDELPAELMQALQEGEEPLGDLLFDRGLSLNRSDLSLARIEIKADEEARWARRSVLRSPSGTRALVVECFQPHIWKRIARSGYRH